jgi:hypothetical protein
MTSRRAHLEEHWRQEIVQEAARLMAESGIEDYELAKRKARERLRLPASVTLPRNSEIQAALIEYRRIFGAQQHDEQLRQLRRVALQVMELLEAYRPRLVGAVLSGAADEHSSVCMHLFAESPEEVAFFLMDRRIPFRDAEQRLRMSSGALERVPGYSFGIEGTAVELLVFSGKLGRQVPLSPVDGRRMRRATPSEVRALLDAPQPALP